MYVNHNNGLWTKNATSRSFESYDQEFRRESPWTKIAYASVEALRYLLHYLLFLGQRDPLPIY